MSDQMASSKETIYDSLNKMADLQHKIWSDWIRAECFEDVLAACGLSNDKPPW
jgi:hypothetical protein